VQWQLRRPKAGGQPEFGRAQQGAGGQHGLAAAQVFAPAADVLPELRRLAQAHLRLAAGIGAGLGLFLHQHRVGPGGKGGASENARHRAGLQGSRRPCRSAQGLAGTHRPGGDALAHRQGSPGGVSRSGFGGAHRVAVHGAVVKTGHVKGGLQRLRQHAAVGFVERHGLDLAQRLRRRQQGRQRVIERQQAGSGLGWVSSGVVHAGGCGSGARV